MLLFFFLMTRPPPTSTLFPYTTLFRSSPCCKAARGSAALTGQTHPPRGGCGDRKSTRLNSSHQIISYAVFCLKKKKIALRIGQLVIDRRLKPSATQRHQPHDPLLGRRR